MKVLIIALSLALTRVRCNVAYWNQFGQLQPIQGLYVKPSTDGTTGDLYVAASENNGVAQWLAEQPFNFLPVSAQQNTLPGIYAAANPHDETVSATQKRAVFSPQPAAFSFALPPVANEAPAALPFTIQTSASTISEVAAPKCSAEKQTPVITYPFQYFYPQMAALMSGALNAAKEVSANGEGATAAVTQPTPLWPQNLAFPIQYLMMDPSNWTQGQASNAAPSTTSSTSTATSSDKA